MTRPHPILIDLAAGRSPRPLDPAEAPALVDAAFEHRMGGLLWSSIGRREVQLPRDEVTRLAARDLAVERHHLQLWAAATELHRRLGALGIGVAFAKGVTAEARWYERLAERSCVDIDVFLEPAALSRLGEVIDALHPAHPLRSDGPALVRSGVLQSIDLVFQGIPIDLHADIFKIEIPTRQRDLVWARTALVSGHDGVRVRALDPELSLVHFLLHLNKDRFARLIGFADVARVLSREELDWAFIESFLAREGIRVPVYASLHAVTSALQLPAPPVPRPGGWRGSTWTRLWPEEGRLLGNRGLARDQHRQLLLPLLTEGRIGEGMRWLLRRRLFPPRAMVPIWYPDTRGPYLMRVAIGRILRARDRRRVAQQVR